MPLTQPTSIFFRPLEVLSLCALLLLTSCSTTPTRRAPSPEDLPPRTELVLLNIPEGSGWVAYRQDSLSQDVEDYRIVVLRQADNTLIYDSIIPLAANMATHGFELAKDDPRLEDLACNVDANIIEPLEAVTPPAEDAMLEEAEPVESTSEVNPAPEPEPAQEDMMQDEAELRPMVMDRLKILRIEGNDLTIGIPEGETLKTDETLYVRSPDKTIAMPGTGEELLVSRGPIAGMVKVAEVEGNIAKAELLNGSVPDRATLEREQ